ncbi:hypothetical protein, partial [Pseudidiomarina sp.]|uniref:hypothetical protein n=1 Tax=Pseudidiomarina sp. TaxID=2081707 RepID=UPI003A96DF7F
KTSAFGGFVACLKRGAHFRDLTRCVKRLFDIFRCFFADCWFCERSAVKSYAFCLIRQQWRFLLVFKVFNETIKKLTFYRNSRGKWP